MADLVPFRPTAELDLPNAFMAHQQMAQAQRQNETQNALAQAVPMLQTDPQNAFATAAKASPQAALQLLPVIKQMDDQKRAQVAERTEALGKLLYGLKQQYKDPVVRKAVAQSRAAELAAHGVTPDQIQGADYSDQGIDLGISSLTSIKDQIAQANADRTYNAGRDDHKDVMKNQDRTFKLSQDRFGLEKDQAAESRRHNKALEGGAVGADGLPDFGDPITQSHVQNILGGNETMAQVPAGYRNKVSMALQKAGGASPMAAQRLTLASSRITQPYTNMAAYKLTADGLPYLQRIDAASKHPGSVSDQDLLDSLTKLNTGGNAVTEAQVTLITGHGSLSDWAGTMANKLKNGGALSDNQRKQIKKIANDIFKNYRNGYEPVYKEAASKLKAAGIPEQYWTIPDLNKLNAGQADILEDKSATAAPSGAIPPPPPGFSVHP